MEQPAQDLGDELRQLYRAAGSPAVDKLVELSQGQLPVSQWPTPSAVHGWFHAGAVPTSCAALLAFVELLDGFARQASDGAHLPRSAQWWELLWYRTTRPPADAPGTGTGGGNLVEGHARLLGPTVQAGAINGGVHVHPPADPGGAPPPSQPPGVPSQRDPRVVIRVQRGTETIEFYDEGLARIWITAVLDQRHAEDGKRNDEH
ncbi:MULTISPECIES: hypothetical protein [Streptomyces]|uniref:Uncharacterized protein n=1 Tax=Streptomyces yunnanensis TaxID=156453 RepID=A0ABY8AFY0_9ACTN|nr:MULTISPECIES: hypothetical protein [Streptomyces]AJC59965.1 hypothetical protein GZL_07413 [Streptomyces sp. 769]WEB43858.1 hypothetical protein MOV08_34340 [Streptomyces yunnanensis]